MKHTKNKTSSVQNQNEVQAKNIIIIIITAGNLPALFVFLHSMMILLLVQNLL
jgi:hypothetical protein